MADFLAFRGAIMRLTVTNAGRNDDRHVGLQVYRYAKSSRSFTRTADKVLPLGMSTTSLLEFVSVKSALNTASGLYQPCLLLRQTPMKRENKEEFHVLLLEDHDSLLSLGSFEVNCTGISRIEFHLVDGPAVCWVLEDAVYFARYDSALENFTVDSLTVDNSMNEQPGASLNLLWCGLIHGEMVAMGAKSEMTDDATLLTRWACVNHSRNKIQEIPLVPDVYVPIATCCCVREPLREVTVGFSDFVCDGLSVFLATNRGQLLEFVSGRLKNWWQLPFNDSCRIWILEVLHTKIGSLSRYYSYGNNNDCPLTV